DRDSAAARLRAAAGRAGQSRGRVAGHRHGYRGMVRPLDARGDRGGGRARPPQPACRSMGAHARGGAALAGALDRAPAYRHHHHRHRPQPEHRAESTGQHSEPSGPGGPAAGPRPGCAGASGPGARTGSGDALPPRPPLVLRNVVALLMLVPVIRILRQLTAPTPPIGFFALGAFFLVNRVRELALDVPGLEQRIFVVEMLVAVAVIMIERGLVRRNE